MKKKLILILCIVFNNAAQEAETEYNKKIEFEKETPVAIIQDDVDNFSEPLIISLGFSCTVADMLRDNNLRCLAFPFDWIRSSLHGLCLLLNDDFLDFLNPHYLDFEKTFILNRKYIITFHHDFPAWKTIGRADYLKENYLEYLKDVEVKYKRRIKRLYRALNSGHTVYFFRLSSCTKPWNLDTVPQTQNEVIQLRDILLKKFSHCNFTLVVIDNDNNYKIDWKMDRIKNFYIQDPMSKDEWIKIFKTLELI